MAESLSLTLREIINLNAALVALDGYIRIIKDDKGEKAVTVPYIFGGRTRSKLSQMFVLTKRFADGYVKTRDDIIKEISGGDRINENDHENVKKFNIESNKALDCNIMVEGIMFISFDDLKLDDNPIPGSILAALAPIIKTV